MLSAVKQLMLVASRGPWFDRVVDLFEKLERPRPNLLRTLAYHRVDEADARPGLDPALLSAIPAAFEAQVAYLARHYSVISMAAALKALRGGPPLPERAVLITFDDAYQDFADHAWPILKSHGLPATLFVPTAYPDHPERPFWWDRLYDAFRSTRHRRDIDTSIGRLSLRTAIQRRLAFRRAKNAVKALSHDIAMSLVDRLCRELDVSAQSNAVLSWDALRKLACEGVTLASHTRTHPLLNRMESQMAAAEVSGSLSDLNREIGCTLPVFAYPSGGYDDMVVTELGRLYVGLALTTVPGVDDLAVSDRLRLRRINVGQHTSLALFRARLLPCAWRYLGWSGFLR